MAISKVKLKNDEVRWEVRLYVDGRGSKKIKRSFTHKVDAEDFEAEFRTKVREEARSPLKNSSFEGKTLQSEIEYWLNDGRMRFSASHIIRVEGITKQLFPKYGNFPIERITPEFLTKFQQSEKQAGMANATINRKTEVITAALNHSVRVRRIPFSPASGFRKLSKSHEEMSFWSLEEAADFLRCMNDLYPINSDMRWVYVVYLMALNTALRAGEIWGLKVMDIAHDGKSIAIKRQFNRVTLDFGPTKSKKSRFVPCNSELLGELKRLFASGRLKPEDTIFRNLEGKPICHDNFTTRNFEKDLERWGGRRVRFHDLRHTATTLMIANRIDIKTVKEICGHADISTTMNYVHLVAGSVERVSEVFVIKPLEKVEKTKLTVVS